MANPASVVGVAELRKKMRSLARQFPKEFKEQVRASTFNIGRNSKKEVAVDTGRLRSSETEEFSDGGFTGEVSYSTLYAVFVELGTSTQDPQPYLEPAFREEAAKFEDQLVDRIRNTLRKA